MNLMRLLELKSVTVESNNRIIPKTGGPPQFFGPKRVWLKNKQAPGLAMTRSIGDLVAKTVGVTYEPEIKVFSNL
jgi:hypothetical protein